MRGGVVARLLNPARVHDEGDVVDLGCVWVFGRQNVSICMQTRSRRSMHIHAHMSNGRTVMDVSAMLVETTTLVTPLGMRRKTLDCWSEVREECKGKACTRRLSPRTRCSPMRLMMESTAYGGGDRRLVSHKETKDGTTADN